MGEHSIEIIMKDEQLNVTPNFYTFDSSKIKVGLFSFLCIGGNMFLGNPKVFFD